jgi:hypothetical protein
MVLLDLLQGLGKEIHAAEIPRLECERDRLVIKLDVEGAEISAFKDQEIEGVIEDGVTGSIVLKRIE